MRSRSDLPRLSVRSSTTRALHAAGSVTHVVRSAVVLGPDDRNFFAAITSALQKHDGDFPSPFVLPPELIAGFEHSGDRDAKRPPRRPSRIECSACQTSQTGVDSESVKHDDIVTIRLPKTLRGKLDRERQRMSRAIGAEVKESSVIRAILEDWVRRKKVRRAAA